MLTKTRRIYTDVEDNEPFALWHDPCTDEYKLISEGSEKCAKGTEVNGFYISAHTAVTIKLNGTKVVHLGMGDFYNLKEGEVITHKKYAGFKRFTKV